MARMFTFVALVTIGCGTHGPVAIDITVDTSAVPAAVLVDAYYATGSPSSMAIATPEILAGTAPAAGAAMTWSGRLLAEAGNHGPIGFGLRSTTGFDHPMYVGVVALGTTGIAGGAWSGPIEHPEDASLELKLDPALQPEVWGTQSETGRCFRLNIGASMVFITRADDPDCDGLTGSQDSQPYAFCDPTAMSGPAHDACR